MGIKWGCFAPSLLVGAEVKGQVEGQVEEQVLVACVPVTCGHTFDRGVRTLVHVARAHALRACPDSTMAIGRRLTCERSIT